MIAAGALSLSAQPAHVIQWPSEQINQRLPRWLRFSGEERIRLEGFDAGGFKADNGDAYLLQRFRFNMKIQPAGWLKVFVQTQDARVFWKNQTPAPPFQATWDLRLAYAEAGDMEKSPVALRVGRQEINLGEQRLVGDAWWGNTPRSFDAARLAFHYRKVRLDAFASSLVVVQDGRVGSVRPGNNLHGLYGGLTNVIPNSTIEPYLLWRLQPGVQSELDGVGHLDMKVMGVRWVGTLPHNFDYRTEVAVERGRLVQDHIRTWAGHWVAGYTFPSVVWKPRLMAEYNYATGDGNSKDGPATPSISSTPRPTTCTASLTRWAGKTFTTSAAAWNGKSLRRGPWPRDTATTGSPVRTMRFITPRAPWWPAPRMDPRGVGWDRRSTL